MNPPNHAAPSKFPWDFRIKKTLDQLALGRKITDREIREIIVRVLRAQLAKAKP